MTRTTITMASLLALGVAACVVESGPDDNDYGPLPGTDASGYYGDGGITGDGAPSATPMLVKVDTNNTLSVSAGQGVGVFTEYDQGGHWYISWTCDTNRSGESCPFGIQVSVKSGAISNANSDGFASTDTLDTSNTKQIVATTTTTTTVEGVRFDTDPGAVITLSATLGGGYSGSFLFFVQDQQINGGYTGALTDPLELQGSSP
jgi:hypothetical protein